MGGSQRIAGEFSSFQAQYHDARHRVKKPEVFALDLRIALKIVLLFLAVDLQVLSYCARADVSEDAPQWCW